ncbi:hypothetical protein [Actinocorallia sp. A-T 12471]|uniref:hypothetical protein n=1 Tax=Actinocorallia sp. A-T 12471 TaxID=3089813 RepID=UPI0029CF066D|nr:hypothetical protein [Actinocorallia sp. A-T 12471]MDX6740732.1 hypothetical protein [Actinocorallia sp. A-T 12471]
MEHIPAEVSISELRQVFEHLIDFVDSHSPSGVVIVERDGFWSIPVIEDDVYEGPPEPTIGMVSESWENLQSMIGGDRVVGYGLVWLSDVLRAIGKELPI